MNSSRDVLSYTDYKQSCSMQKFSLTAPCPAWANDMVLLKRVVAGKICQIAHRRGTDIPTDLDELRKIEAQAVAVLRKAQGSSKEVANSLDRMERIGGLLEFFTAIAWRRFRLGQSSPTIAADLGVKPVVVRRHAAGLAHIARALYPHDQSYHLPRAHNAKVEIKPFGVHRYHRPEWVAKRAEVIRLRDEEHLTYRAIAKRLGMQYETVRAAYNKHKKDTALTWIIHEVSSQKSKDALKG